ncbi:hypothetical protein [Sinorhizobium fredii]|uniref:hypothetical protein n=1 Tax=Rhizobium fredii TaxID=380 RepID=UPI0012FD5F6C|nr:hypothetical protein [Sinorhizobium fredii]
MLHLPNIEVHFLAAVLCSIWYVTHAGTLCFGRSCGGDGGSAPSPFFVMVLMAGLPTTCLNQFGPRFHADTFEGGQTRGLLEARPCGLYALVLVNLRSASQA